MRDALRHLCFIILFVSFGTTALLVLLLPSRPDASVDVRNGTCTMYTRWTGSTQLMTKRLPNGGVECTVIWEPQ